MMGLSDGRKSFPIGLAVLIQYRSVSDTQSATQPATQPPSHVAVAITLNAQASSLIKNMAKARTSALDLRFTHLINTTYLISCLELYIKAECEM